MATLKELSEVGESLDFKETDLHDYIKEEQSRACEDNMKNIMILRELEKEKLELEHKHKLELIDKWGDTQLIFGYKIKGPKLPPFEEKSDGIDSYLRRFERHAEAHNWHTTIWATHLRALLKGNTLGVYALLSSEHALDYDVLKGCLLKRFDKTEDDVKQKFRACRPESGETFQQFAARLGVFFNRWIAMSGIDLDYGKLRDLMIRYQCLHVCNKDVLLFLKERVTKDIGEMSLLADRFQEAHRANVVSLTNQNLRRFPKNDRNGEDN